MTVTEHLMRPGTGSLRFDPYVPVSVTEQIRQWVDENAGGPGAHIVITPVPIDAAGITLADLLGTALYTGTITARPSRLSLEFDGIGRWLDSDVDAEITRSAGTPAQWVGDLVANGITAGIDVGVGSNVSRTIKAHSMKRRDALDNVAGIGGWEYEIRPDFTTDHGTAANLFRQAGDDDTVVVTAREEGPDGNLRGVDGGLLDQKLTRLGPSIATKAVALAEGSGSAIATGAATRTPNLKAWDGTAPEIVKVFSAPSEESANADTAATNFLNLQTMRRQLAVSSNTAGVRRLIRPGDEAYAWQLESGLWEASNQIQFRGETISPITVRLLSLNWPIDHSYGVYIFNNAATPTVLDVTRWVEDEGTTAFWTVGDWSPPRYGTANRTNPEIEERVSAVGGTYTPTLTGMAIGTGGGATNTADYSLNADVMTIEGVIVFGTTGATLPTGSIRASLPSGFQRAVTSTLIPIGGGTALIGGTSHDLVLRFASATEFQFRARRANVADVVQSSPTATVPGTWAAGDVIAYSATCRITR